MNQSQPDDVWAGGATYEPYVGPTFIAAIACSYIARFLHCDIVIVSIVFPMVIETTIIHY